MNSLYLKKLTSGLLQLILPVLLLLFPPSISAQALQIMQYEPDQSNFANPERGYYSHTEVHSPNYTLLDRQTLESLRTQSAITQILRVFYLEDFRNQPINDQYLINMQRDFVAVRDAGLKIIVRFAYSQGTSAPYKDATPEIVLMHIHQLKPILNQNADVIATVQAGFIGTWGEWHFTDHFAQTPGNISDDDWSNRKKVVDALLEAIPTDRTIQIRTPGYKMILYDSEIPLTEAEAFSTQDKSRVGHHNDCFVASSSDFGTYLNPEVEKPYLASETLYLPMGGETCALASPYSDCENATAELERFHWSYLNIDYNREVLNEWDQQGCLEEVARRLGHRHRLVSSELSESTKPGGSLTLNLTFINEGYANFYNSRDFLIVLHSESGSAYHYKPKTETRRWPLGDEHTLNLEVGLPDDMKNGNYSVHLHLPDPYPNLAGRGEYAVRLANQSTWDSETGYNDLGMTVFISNDNTSLPDYQGTEYFVESAQNEILEVGGSDIIQTTVDQEKVVVYWPVQKNDFVRLVERSENGDDFQVLASLNSEVPYLIDTEITAESTYIYRYSLLENGKKSPYAISPALHTLENESHVVDGAIDDWNGVPPLLSAYQNDFFVLRCFFGLDQGFFLVQEGSDYQIYLDIDNDQTSGSLGADFPDGTDLQLANGNILSYENNSWIELGSLAEVSADGLTELSFPFEVTDKLSDNPGIGIYATIDGVILDNGSTNNPTHYRVLPPDAPVLQDVTNDPLNETALVITWQECDYCNGYILERSEGNEDNYQEIGTFEKAKIELRDRDLAISSTYYYRLKSFNSLGQSVYSNIGTGVPGEVLGSGNSTALTIYPNPTAGDLQFSHVLQNVYLFALDGSHISYHKNSTDLSLENIKPGTYLLRAEFKGSTIEKKIVRIK